MNLSLCSFVAALFLVPVTAEVYTSAQEVEPVSVGEQAPNPALRTLDGAETTLEELRMGKPTVLVFYRGGWCPYCTRHLAALQKALPEINARGWQVLAVSPDQPSKLTETLEANDLGYALVSDSTLEAAKAFGLAFQVDEPTLGKLEGYGIDLVAASGQNHRQLPVPAVIAMDAQGRVVFVHHDPDYKKRLSAESLLEAISDQP
jgi:peroxiredoxin